MKQHIKSKLYIDSLILFLLLCFSSGNVSSQTAITPFVKPEKQYINLGPCAINDTLLLKVEVKSDYDGTLFMTDITPSFAIGKHPLDQNSQPQNFEFISLFDAFPYTFEKGTIDTFDISYKPRLEDQLELFPYGWKYAVLQMGLTKTITQPYEFQYAVQYYLKAKKTPLFADGYDDVYNFDSVYVNPILPKKYSWRVKNVKNFDVKINAQNSNLLSDKKTDDEFFIQDRFAQTNEVEIRPKNIVTWEVAYSPKDTEADSMLIELYYQRDEQKTDTIWVRAVGTGVKQELEFVDINRLVSNDTILLGDILVFEKARISGKLYNKGNLPFGKKNSYLSKSQTQSPDFKWNYVVPLLSEGEHLNPDSLSAFSFDLEFEQPGDFVLKFEVESDIADRGIFGVPDTVIYKNIYISGRCVAPELNAVTDTIDMGDVVLNRLDCPSSMDTLYTVFNSGNYPLQVEFALDPEYPNTRFVVEPRNIEVGVNQQQSINIHFESEIYGEYFTDLLIIANTKNPRDTIRVPLRAVSIPPVQASLTLPNVNAKPGRVISLPIILTSDKISPAFIAGSYNDILYYNPTLLKYRSYSLLGTASEFVPNPRIFEISPGNLQIDISHNGDDKFLPLDTLIILNFETYLGDAVETPIRFSNPRFGNNNCSNILDIPENNIRNSTFKLDSICGLEYIITPSTSSLFAIKKLSPLPADRILTLEFNVAAKSYVEYKIVNTYGEVLYHEDKTIMPEGVYERDINVSMLPVGIYSLEFSAGIYKETKGFVIIR